MYLIAEEYFVKKTQPIKPNRITMVSGMSSIVRCECTFEPFLISDVKCANFVHRSIISVEKFLRFFVIVVVILVTDYLSVSTV